MRSGISAAYLERLPTFGMTAQPEQLPIPEAAKPAPPGPPKPQASSEPSSAPTSANLEATKEEKASPVEPLAKPDVTKEGEPKK
jgi:hypothetical protein